MKIHIKPNATQTGHELDTLQISLNMRQNIYEVYVILTLRVSGFILRLSLVRLQIYVM